MSSILDAVTKDAERSGKIPDADGPPPRDPGKGGGRFRSTAIVVVLGLLIGAGASRMLGGSDEAVDDDLLTDKVASRAKPSTPPGEGPVAPVPPADADEIAVAAKPSPDARGKARKDVAAKEDREKPDAKAGRRADRKDGRDPGDVGDVAKVVTGAAPIPAAAPPPVVAPMPAAAPPSVVAPIPAAAPPPVVAPMPGAAPPPVGASPSIPAPAAAVAPVAAPVAAPPSLPVPTPPAPAASPAVTATKKPISPPAPVAPAVPVPSLAPALVATTPSPAPSALPPATAPTQVASVSPPVVAVPASPVGTANTATSPPPPSPAPVAPVVAKPVAPPPAPPAAKAPPPPPSPAVVDQAFRSVVADEVAPAAPPARPLLEEKPEGAPEVFILFVAWSKKPAERLVSMRVGTGPLNVVHEGESVEGLQIATIHPEAVDLVWTGRAYRVPMREF